MTVSEGERVRRLLFDTVAVSVLRKIVDAAASAGVTVAPVKGVVLSRWLYDDVSDRPYRDLDVVIARDDLPRMFAAVEARGWPIQVHSPEMGELEFTVDRLTVEIHAEFGRRDLSRLTIADLLARATVDGGTFPFEIRRIDDIDHFLLLVANVTKKAFTYANPHQPADLERFLARLRPRWGELRRAGASGALPDGASQRRRLDGGRAWLGAVRRVSRRDAGVATASAARRDRLAAAARSAAAGSPRQRQRPLRSGAGHPDARRRSPARSRARCASCGGAPRGGSDGDPG